MKELLIVTNNPVFAKEAHIPPEAELQWVDGEVDAVFQTCLRALDEGWYLAVDPIAGYRVRPCPVHTVLLARDPCLAYGEGGEGYLWAINALQFMMEKFSAEKEDFRAHARNPKILGGHMAVDHSIASRSLDHLSLHLSRQGQKYLA